MRVGFVIVICAAALSAGPVYVAGDPWQFSGVDNQGLTASVDWSQSEGPAGAFYCTATVPYPYRPVGYEFCGGSSPTSPMNPQFSYSVTGLNGIARIGDLSSRTFEYVLAEFGGYLKLYGDGGDVIASVDISGQPAFRWSLFQDDCRACSIGVGLDSIELVQCPEPATMMLIGASMAGLGFLRRRTVLPS